MHPALRLPHALLLTILFIAPGLAAQDVTVGEPVWLLNSPAPSSLSDVKNGLSPSYPQDMRASDRIGYATVVRYVSQNDRALLLTIQATDPLFEKSVETNSHSLDNVLAWNPDGFNHSWKPRAAMVDGLPVDTFVWVPVIFNPASASVDGPEATPRLLSVAPVYVNSKYLHTDGSPTLAHVRVSLDASGEILAVTPLAPETERFYWPTIQKAVAQWRFAPARKEGSPIAAEIDLAVLAQPLFRLAARVDKPPELLKSVMPAYPDSMENIGVRGQVTVKFTVDTEGNVENPVVVQSNNPAFNENALLAINRWKYTPAMSGGRAVRMSLVLPITFQMQGQPYYNGGSAYSMGEGSSESGPRENGPPIVRNVVDPVYPYDLLRDGVTGSANARMIVDKQGRVAAVEILAASRPQFALALQAALEGFTFEPALLNGVPGFARVTYGHDFSKKDLDSSDNGDALDREENSPRSIHNYSELDQPLKPISRAAPLYPLSLRGTTLTGTATVEFLVSKNGRVCLPRVITASAPEFGYAAVQAVSAWLYYPPIAGGSPVAVRLRVPFNFKIPRSRS